MLYNCTNSARAFTKSSCAFCISSVVRVVVAAGGEPNADEAIGGGDGRRSGGDGRRSGGGCDSAAGGVADAMCSSLLPSPSVLLARGDADVLGDSAAGGVADAMCSS